jgi:hypothetical protein
MMNAILSFFGCKKPSSELIGASAQLRLVATRNSHAATGLESTIRDFLNDSKALREKGNSTND